MTSSPAHAELLVESDEWTTASDLSARGPPNTTSNDTFEGTANSLTAQTAHGRPNGLLTFLGPTMLRGPTSGPFQTPDATSCRPS
jgi:hypothetical protein